MVERNEDLTPRPGTWVPGFGWLAWSTDLTFGDQVDHRANPWKRTVIVNRWADGEIPAAPAPLPERPQPEGAARFMQEAADWIDAAADELDHLRAATIPDGLRRVEAVRKGFEFLSLMADRTPEEVARHEGAVKACEMIAALLAAAPPTAEPAWECMHGMDDCRFRSADGLDHSRCGWPVPARPAEAPATEDDPDNDGIPLDLAETILRSAGRRPTRPSGDGGTR